MPILVLPSPNLGHGLQFWISRNLANLRLLRTEGPPPPPNSGLHISVADGEAWNRARAPAAGLRRVLGFGFEILVWVVPVTA